MQIELILFAIIFISGITVYVIERKSGTPRTKWYLVRWLLEAAAYATAYHFFGAVGTIFAGSGIGALVVWDALKKTGKIKQK